MPIWQLDTFVVAAGCWSFSGLVNRRDRGKLIPSSCAHFTDRVDHVAMMPAPHLVLSAAK